MLHKLSVSSPFGSRFLKLPTSVLEKFFPEMPSDLTDNSIVPETFYMANGFRCVLHRELIIRGVSMAKCEASHFGNGLKHFALERLYCAQTQHRKSPKNVRVEARDLVNLPQIYKFSYEKDKFS